MKAETRKALEAELSRCDVIRREFSSDEMFALFAIVHGWPIERARIEFKNRIMLRASFKTNSTSIGDAA